MRTVVVVGRDAPTSADFPLDDLPGAGRMDLLARCVTAALLRSHGIRESVQVRLVLSDSFTVRFDGATLQGLHPDERSTAALVRAALDEREAAIGHIPVETSPGVSLVRMGLAETLAAAGGQVYRLHEDGQPATDCAPPANPTLVLSDHRPFRAGDAPTLEDAGARRLSLGPTVLHADHAIAVAHNWLDTDGFETY